VGIGVLAVRGNEHDVEDNEVTSSDVARAGQRGKDWGSHTDEPGTTPIDGRRNVSRGGTEPDFQGLGIDGYCWIWRIQGPPVDREALQECLTRHFTRFDVTIRCTDLSHIVAAFAYSLSYATTILSCPSHNLNGFSHQKQCYPVIAQPLSGMGDKHV
jgi:hypothetical protein